MPDSRKLNIDILNQIVKYIDIENIEVACKSLVPTISKHEIDSIIRHRENPMILLRNLTNKPELLLLSMGFAEVVLSGSRATEYFYPGIISNESDWDFYCPPKPELVNAFETFLEIIGVKWVHRINADRDEEIDSNNKYYGFNITIGKIECNGTIHTIQLIRDTMDRYYPFNIIVKFHSSIVQNFISISGAVCMYKNLTMKGRSIAWDSRIENRVAIKDSQEARSKYILRGIKYMSYEWYTNVDQDIENHYISPEIINTRERKIGDENSKIISFNCYYSEEINKLGIIYDRNRSEPYQFEGLCQFEGLYWLENPYRCSSLMHRYSVLQISSELPLETLAKLYCLYPELSVLLKLQKTGRMLPNDPLRLRNMMEALSNFKLNEA